MTTNDNNTTTSNTRRGLTVRGLFVDDPHDPLQQDDEVARVDGLLASLPRGDCLLCATLSPIGQADHLRPRGSSRSSNHRLQRRSTVVRPCPPSTLGRLK